MCLYITTTYTIWDNKAFPFSVLLFINAIVFCLLQLLFSIQSAARVIKETMDKRYGATWHCVVGEAFGFEVSYEVKNLLYMFFAGNLAIAVWKCC